MKVPSLDHFKIHSLADAMFLVCDHSEWFIGAFSDNRQRG